MDLRGILFLGMHSEFRDPRRSSLIDFSVNLGGLIRFFLVNFLIKAFSFRSLIFLSLLFYRLELRYLLSIYVFN
jgi:hypothetical protein